MKRKGLKDNEIMDSLMIKESIFDYFHPLFRKYEKLINLMDSNSFYDFIYSLENKNNSFITDFLSKIAYPFVLFIACIIGAYFFDKSIIPMLNDSILLFSDDSQSLFVYHNILRFFWIFMIVAFALLMLFSFRLTNKFYFIKTYDYFYDLSSRNIFVLYYSNVFAKYYLSLLENGLSTNLIIDSLVKQNENSMINSFASYMKNELNNGEKLTNVIEKINIDNKLKQSFKIGEQTGELVEILNDYIEISEILIRRKIDKLSKIITYTIYSLVSLFIALFYRLLMTPLSVIRSL